MGLVHAGNAAPLDRGADGAEGAPRAPEASTVRQGGSTAEPRRSSEPAPTFAGNPAAAPDGYFKHEPYTRHHRVIGYEYVPGASFTLPRPDGGIYELVVNSAGLRSKREYSFKKPADVFRILAFGDSMAAGMFQSSECRFSELIEARNPRLEILNFCLPGTGTDQQLLTFEELGRKYEYDLIMVLPYLTNIQRNLYEWLLARDPASGRTILRPKPRFVLVELPDGTERLELRNVPVPEESREVESTDVSPGPSQPKASLTRRIKSALDGHPIARAVKRVVYPLLNFDPLVEYKDPESPEWRLMSAILRRFAEETDDKPFVIVPLFHVSYVRYRMGRSYMDRFDSLRDGRRIFTIDVLPYFRGRGCPADDFYLLPHDPHMSDLAHSVLADAVEAELKRLDLLPPWVGGPNARM